MSTDGDDWTAMASEAPARSRMPIAIAAAALIAIAAGGAYVAKRSFAAPTVVVPTTGVLTVASNPPGATVFVDNVEHGADAIDADARRRLALRRTARRRRGANAADHDHRRHADVASIELPATAASTVGAAAGAHRTGWCTGISGRRRARQIARARREPRARRACGDDRRRFRHDEAGGHGAGGDDGVAGRALSMASMTSMTAMTSTAATAGGEGSALSGGCRWPRPPKCSCSRTRS